MPNPEDIIVESLVVSYTVKELLSQIHDSVGRIDAKLDTKATAADLNLLADRVSLLELAKAKLYGGAAVIGFLSGGGGWLLASIAQGTG